MGMWIGAGRAEWRRRRLFLSPLSGFVHSPQFTHSLRCGLHSFAASRLTPADDYCLTAQARPSGSTPTSIFPITSNVFRSITET